MGFRLVLTAAIVIGSVIETSLTPPNIVLDGPSGTLTAAGLGQFVRLNNGEIILGNAPGGVPTLAGAATVKAIISAFPVNQNTLQFTSPESGAQSDPLVTTMYGGTPATATGQISTPRLKLVDQASSSAADLLLSGSVIATDLTGVPVTWQAPSYGTNWSASTTFNGTTGIQPLQFHLDGQNRMYAVGAFKAGAVAPSDPVAVLPVGYFNPNETLLIPAMINNAGTVTAGAIRVTNAGHFDVTGSTNTPIVAGAEYWVNGDCILGALP